MPCLEISMPRQSSQTRQKIARQLAKLFAVYANYDAEALGIRFYEYDIGEAANGRAIWDGRTGKPYIHFKLHIPVRTIGEKKNLIEKFTQAFTDCLNKPDWQPVIFINEYSDDNIGYDGLSLSDHKKRQNAG